MNAVDCSLNTETTPSLIQFPVKTNIKYKQFVFSVSKKSRKHLFYRKLCISFFQYLVFLYYGFHSFEETSCNRKSAGMFFHSSKVQSTKLVVFSVFHDPSTPTTFSDLELWTLAWSAH